MKQAKRVWVLGLIAALALPAYGYIKVLMPLQQFLSESEVIAEGVIESADAQKKTCVIKVTKSLKGKCAYTQIRLDLSRGIEWHPEAAMKHYVVGAKAILFYGTDKYRNNSWKGEIYVNRYFSSLRVKNDVAPDKAVWEWEQIEIMLNRTFNGTAEELSTILAGAVSGKQKPPAPDDRVPQIKKEDVLALPSPGAKTAETKLPPPFRKGGQ